MAANPLKGEVELVIGETTYTLCFSSNSIVAVEQLFGGVGIGEIAADLNRVEHQRALLWGALQKYHDGIELLAAGDLVDECEDGLKPIAEKLARALRFRISRTPVDAPFTDDEE